MNSRIDTPVSASAMPLVSIGVPVYNEERFLDASLRSLRNQDYPNLEILIGDNASTDNTLSVCERHASEDSRVRIYRTKENVGVMANFERVLEPAAGTYFMWASGHDLWTANLISACVESLEASGDACLAFASSNWIGADDQLLSKNSGWSDTRGLSPAARLFTIFWGNMHPVVGVIRTAALRKCLPMVNVVGGDMILLAELALRGDFVHAASPVWSRREFRTEATYDDKLKRYVSVHTGISSSRAQRRFPLLALPLALLGVVARSSLTRIDKFLVGVALIGSFPVRYVVGRRSKQDAS